MQCIPIRLRHRHGILNALEAVFYPACPFAPHVRENGVSTWDLFWGCKVSELRARRTQQPHSGLGAMIVALITISDDITHLSVTTAIQIRLLVVAYTTKHDPQGA